MYLPDLLKSTKGIAICKELMIHFGKDENVSKSIELYVFSNLKYLINEDKASHFIEFLLDNEYYALVLFNYLVGNNS
jgi:hypothetical protein